MASSPAHLRPLHLLLSSTDSSARVDCENCFEDFARLSTNSTNGHFSPNSILSCLGVKPVTLKWNGLRWGFLAMINSLKVPGCAKPMWKFPNDTTISELIPSSRNSNFQQAVDCISNWSQLVKSFPTESVHLQRNADLRTSVNDAPDKVDGYNFKTSSLPKYFALRFRTLGTLLLSATAFRGWLAWLLRLLLKFFSIIVHFLYNYMFYFTRGTIF